jgi:hypothetical protein
MPPGRAFDHHIFYGNIQWAEILFCHNKDTGDDYGQQVELTD